MPSMTTEDYRYFENKIYLPMLITVLERDRETVLKSPFKLGRPYVAIIDKALDIVRADLKATDIYLKRRNMRLASEKLNGGSIEYTYIYMGYEERYKFTSDELRDKTEKLMSEYFVK